MSPPPPQPPPRLAAPAPVAAAAGAAGCSRRCIRWLSSATAARDTALPVMVAVAATRDVPCVPAARATLSDAGGCSSFFRKSAAPPLVAAAAAVNSRALCPHRRDRRMLPLHPQRPLPAPPPLPRAAAAAAPAAAAATTTLGRPAPPLPPPPLPSLFLHSVVICVSARGAVGGATAGGADDGVAAGGGVDDAAIPNVPLVLNAGLLADFKAFLQWRAGAGGGLFQGGAGAGLPASHR